MTQQDDITQRVLTDAEILTATLYGQSEARMIRNGRAIESAVLSKLRAPVADDRADAQEYGSPADVAQRIEQYLAQDGRMNSGTQLLYEAMKALRASQGDRNDG